MTLQKLMKTLGLEELTSSLCAGGGFAAASGAEGAGGDLTLGVSPTLDGARVETFMRWSHADRLPLGGVATTVVAAAATNPNTELYVTLAGDMFNSPLRHAPPLEAAARLSAL